MKKIALCPGTYDPVTEGHKDIIERCAKVFDKVIVAVSENPRKNPMYSLKQRIEFIERVFKNNSKVEVLAFAGLLVNIAEKTGSCIIVKGLRAISDFEYEFQMAQMNKKLNPKIESMFLVSNPKYAYLSSSLVREVASFKGCIKGLVPPEIEMDIIKSFENKK
ncbi:MAG: pantetheine-phosphate adenylyltransferase [Actinobacteria bacterium]|nr:pantetheine-phosphate adenylyltransferase [Actinomycetota bacterium]